MDFLQKAIGHPYHFCDHIFTNNHANAHDGNHEPNLNFTEGYDNDTHNRVNSNNESFVISVMLQII